MHRKITLTVSGGLYYALAWFALASFDAGLVVTALALFGLPAMLISYFSYAPTPVLVSVVALGLGTALTFESVAHIYGLWYTVGSDEWRLFGLVPFEGLIAMTLELTFLALLYEQIFDDGEYTVGSARARLVALLVFVLAVLLLLGVYYVAATLFFVSYSFSWLVIVMLGASVAALSVYRVYSVQFFDRLVHFSLIGAIPSCIALALSVTNVHKVFANTAEYIYTIDVFGQAVPIEAFVLTLAVPFFVATIYEIYLDDRS